MILSTKVIDAPEEAINPNEPFSLAALFGIAPGTTTWPVHEVGREADFFDPKSARLLKAGGKTEEAGRIYEQVTTKYPDNIAAQLAAQESRQLKK